MIMFRDDDTVYTFMSCSYIFLESVAVKVGFGLHNFGSYDVLAAVYPPWRLGTSVCAHAHGNNLESWKDPTWVGNHRNNRRVSTESSL